jgi:hypothetical protein
MLAAVLGVMFGADVPAQGDAQLSDVVWTMATSH